MGLFVRAQLSKECRSIKEIRDFLRKCNYISDEEQFGRKDYWMPPNEFDFWSEDIEPLLRVKGIHKHEVSTLYYKRFKTRLGDYRLKKLLELWLDIGLIVTDSDPEDKRRELLFHHEYEHESPQEAL